MTKTDEFKNNVWLGGKQQQHQQQLQKPPIKKRVMALGSQKDTRAKRWAKQYNIKYSSSGRTFLFDPRQFIP